MSKLVWTYDPTTKVLVGSGKQVSDDYLLQGSETFVEPQAGLIEPLIWDGTKWIGTSIDDALETSKSGPSAEMQAINALGLVVAKMQANEVTPSA